MKGDLSYSCTDEACKVVLVYGGDSQSGVTMISQALAETAGKKGKKVLYLPMSPNRGMDYFPESFQGNIDSLECQWKDENRQMLLDSYIESGNEFDFIPPARSYSGWKRMDEDFLLSLITYSARMYDQIIIDGGSGPEVKHIRQIFGHADRIVIIISQNEKMLRRFKQIFPSVLEYCQGNEGNILYVINRFNGFSPFPTVSEISKEMGWEDEKVVRIDYVPYGWQAEKERKTLMWNKKFAGGVRKVFDEL